MSRLSDVSMNPQAGADVSPNPHATSLDARTHAAVRLHEFLLTQHWDGSALVGPDVGIRFNYRIGRFIKSYFRRVRWHDQYRYIQAQAYWILDNWQLLSSTNDDRYRDIALRCSEYILAQQRNDGAWIYPNPEWRGRIATAEGTWGSLALIESHRRTGNEHFLTGARAWHYFLTHRIGFQKVDSELAINYFYGRTGSRVPNNSGIVLRFFSELADASGEERYLQPCRGLLHFLKAVQTPAGEFPYAVKGELASRCWRHFQCYQYNAFLCLDLMRYYDLTGDATVKPLIRNVLAFLREAIAEDGHSFFECGQRYREVTYHTAVLAQTFARVGLSGYEALANRAYSYLLKAQRPDGSFRFSQGDYFLLSDERPYPRNLAMILFHLLPVTRVQVHRPEMRLSH